MIKSEHMLSYTRYYFENCMYLKLIYFHYHNLTLSSEKNYKKQAQMFNQNYSLAIWTLGLKCT